MLMLLNWSLSVYGLFLMTFQVSLERVLRPKDELGSLEKKNDMGPVGSVVEITIMLSLQII